MQNKPDACDARKYVNTDKERSRNDETLRNNDSQSDRSDNGSDEEFILPYKRKKGDSNENGDRSYGSNDERNEKGDCHENSEKPRRSIRKKGVKKWVVNDDFEAQAVKSVKVCQPHALACEDCLDILLLKFHLRKEYVKRCRKMVPSRKAHTSNVLTTVACIFCQKRDILKSVWAEYMKKKRVTVKALP